ncbi:hypothetical protein BN1012_Phect2215 [Candidatus Phaeomarinobacter ectocarpi]|uniref:Cytochrome C oxidase assembly protein n=1 Tax=Candidatus Phaeomarinibacter ectocarpi TaxID=1458461 RepID=X5M9U3_9HYPH|nr:hypothetical protein [Candidatus Phaeomarinobacter ectocarpi]CDO60428.1 hypothetical protein BN1012_Phect2215 [Candidatus Phaeomarinobacter ectocarpi]
MTDHEDKTTETTTVTLTPEQQARLRRRNIAVALGLIAMVGLFFAMTLVRLGGNVADRTY